MLDHPYEQWTDRGLHCRAAPAVAVWSDPGIDVDAILELGFLRVLMVAPTSSVRHCANRSVRSAASRQNLKFPTELPLFATPWICKVLLQFAIRLRLAISSPAFAISWAF